MRTTLTLDPDVAVRLGRVEYDLVLMTTDRDFARLRTLSRGGVLKANYSHRF
jgi:hypothetical protein